MLSWWYYTQIMLDVQLIPVDFYFIGLHISRPMFYTTDLKIIYIHHLLISITDRMQHSKVSLNKLETIWQMFFLCYRNYITYKIQKCIIIIFTIIEVYKWVKQFIHLQNGTRNKVNKNRDHEALWGLFDSVYTVHVLECICETGDFFLFI